MWVFHVIKAKWHKANFWKAEDPSVQFSPSIVSDSLWPRGLQHTGPPCPSPTPGAYSNSCPSSQWCHPAISSSVVPSSSCPQSFPALGSFPMSQFFALGGQSIGASASASVVPMNIQDWWGDLTSPFTVVELVWKSCRVLVCLCISVSVVEKEVT